MKHFDVIIVGAGSIGMAAGYYLAKNNVKTLLIDAFDPPHVYGSHHGDTRIIRYAYGEGREYVPLALRSQELWYELEQQVNEKLFEQTGVLCFGPVGSKFVDETIASAKEFSLPFEVLSGKDIKAKWRGIEIPDDYLGCYEPTSGVLYSEEIVRAYRKLALDSGATLLTNTPVTNIEMKEDGAIVSAKDQVFSTDKLVVCAGAWSGKLLSELNLPLKPTRQTVAWFKADEDLYQSSVFPAFFVDVPEGKYYGFPSIEGAGVKLGRFDDDQPINPDDPRLEFGSFDFDEGDVRHFLKAYMLESAGKLNRGKACLFTRTPDGHFLIDQYPGHPHVMIAAGFSGHGFKFASGIGEVLCQMTMNGEAKLDLSLFSLHRDSLQSSVRK
ncbi:N-methyl-L-tryptophan oxidase [Metabacillus litoralis]|jgi:monomeric sarcosine oxidase|uniref:N-methyl-L-tryptophan oxidase n=1 Tax=Metabacillus litoralis TaxID=152268 RepID=UPI00203C3452|nr:N-methyl-L-tryptophan oxidase [Metabacillus litoralis]MCM3653809.1 N-methyl-L-tryptophan oxidase [Metabacillus litoralis]